MRRLTIGVIAAVAIAATACSSSDRLASVRDSSGLPGVWQTDRFAMSPSGYYQVTLTFGPGIATTNETRMYGVYPGQRADDVSSYSRVTGSFNATSDSLRVAAATLATWDYFNGANSPEHVVDLTSIAGRNTSAAFRLNGDELVLSYVAYPADAPVATKETFHRVR